YLSVQRNFLQQLRCHAVLDTTAVARASIDYSPPLALSGLFSYSAAHHELECTASVTSQNLGGLTAPGRSLSSHRVSISRFSPSGYDVLQASELASCHDPARAHGRRARW